MFGLQVGMFMDRVAQARLLLLVDLLDGATLRQRQDQLLPEPHEFNQVAHQE